MTETNEQALPNTAYSGLTTDSESDKRIRNGRALDGYFVDWGKGRQATHLLRRQRPTRLAPDRRSGRS
jgi:hypothetical protein